MIDEQTNSQLRAKYNPDGSPLRDLQLHLLEIFKVVDGICRRNDIPYWLSCGTLLGAIRHGGFIPWDDDIDIEIYYRDKNRFIEACKKELPLNLCIQYHGTEPDYYLNILKVRDLNSDIGEQLHLGTKGNFDVPYKAKGYFVDIFCEESVIPYFLKVSNGLYYRLLIKRFVKHWNPKISHSCFKILQIFDGFFRMLSICFANKNFLYHSYGSCFHSRRNIHYIEPLKEIKYENLTTFCPSNSDGYLRDLFGDYMKLPPEDLRVSRHAQMD